LTILTTCDGLGANAGDDVARDADVDVGIEQGGADLAQHLVDVRLGETAFAAQTADDAVESVGQVLEHSPPSMSDLPRNGFV
jgi:hypothetical protein